MIIVPFETEARMMFGVCNMEQILAVSESQNVPFSTARDVIWGNLEQGKKALFFHLAKQHCS